MSNKTLLLAIAASLLVGWLLGWCLKGCTQNSPEVLSKPKTEKVTRIESKPLEPVKVKKHVEILKGQSLQGSDTVTDSTSKTTAKLDYKLAVSDSGAVSLDYELSLLPIYFTVFETVTVTKPELQYIEQPWWQNNWFYATLAAVSLLVLSIIY